MSKAQLLGFKKPFNFSEPQFPQLQNRDNDDTDFYLLAGLLQRLNEGMFRRTVFCKLLSSTYIGYFVSTGETWASLVAQQWRTCLPMQETWSLGQEDPLEKEMATHSSVSAQEIPRTEEIRGLKSMGRYESDMT